MSAVNNTLREIILRERPLTVTNNGRLSLFLSFSFSSLSCIFSARAFTPLLPLVWRTPPIPSPFTPLFREPFTFPMHFSATLHVHALEMRKRSWSVPALESMNVPEKKNQAIVVGTILCLNWYSYLFGIYRVYFSTLFYSSNENIAIKLSFFYKSLYFRNFN